MTTTSRGLGWSHQKRRAYLLRNHVDGSPCPCLSDNACGPACPCRPHGRGLPMYRRAELNPDALPIEADHTLARSRGGQAADRLMLATCNRSRGDGTRGSRESFRTVVTSRDW
jgi:hypothetical protein